MNLVFRRVNLSDLDQLYEIEVKSFDERLYYPKYLLKSLMNDCGNLFYVAESKGRIIGYIVARLEEYKAHIVSIAVDPKYRGKGVGGKLMDEILDKLKDSKIKTVELEVSTRNKVAVNLYLKKGFKIAGEVYNYYGLGRHAYKMTLSFKR